jgi:tol-pal system protein YbgF
MAHPLRTLALVTAASTLAACFVPLEAGRQMQSRIDRLEVQSAEQQRASEEQKQAVRERVEKVDQKIREVQAKIDELNQAARRSGADLGVTLSRLQDEFAKVKGELEVAQHRLAEVDRAVGGLRADTDARFTALKGQGALDGYEARQRIASLPKQDDKAAFFALAHKEEEQGEKGVAREIYAEYVRKWPSDPRSADAGFRAGELLFGQKRFREALLSYGKVAEDFPRSERAPEALLGAAESMLRLEMKDDAVAVLRQVVEKYPKSESAAKAKARLQEIAPPPEKVNKITVPEKKKGANGKAANGKKK